MAFSTLGCPAWTVERTVEAAVSHGFGGIEWRCADGALLGPATPDEVWVRIDSAMSAAGLRTVCLDTSCAFAKPSADERAAAEDEARVMAVRAAALGCRYLRVFAGRLSEGTLHADAAAAAGPSLQAACLAAADLGVEVLVECHDDWSTSSALRLLLDEAPAARVLWDVVHSHRAGELPAQTVAALGEVIRHVHLKDADGEALVPMGTGTVDLEGAVSALRASGYDGWYAFEHEKLWVPALDEPEVAFPHAADAMRRLLG